MLKVLLQKCLIFIKITGFIEIYTLCRCMNLSIILCPTHTANSITFCDIRLQCAYVGDGVFKIKGVLCLYRIRKILYAIRRPKILVKKTKHLEMNVLALLYEFAFLKESINYLIRYHIRHHYTRKV